MPVLIMLAAVWTTIGVQWFLRRRREGRPDNSVMSFRAQLSTLERATPGTSLRNLPPGSASIAGMAMPTTPQHVERGHVDQKRRRRDVLLGLAGATAFTLLLLVSVGGSFVTVLFLLSASATAAYVYALRQMHLRAMERAAKVRPLRRREPVVASYPLHHTASN